MHIIALFLYVQLFQFNVVFFLHLIFCFSHLNSLIPSFSCGYTILCFAAVVVDVRCGIFA